MAKTAPLDSLSREEQGSLRVAGMWGKAERKGKWEQGALSLNFAVLGRMSTRIVFAAKIRPGDVQKRFPGPVRGLPGALSLPLSLPLSVLSPYLFSLSSLSVSLSLLPDPVLLRSLSDRAAKLLSSRQAGLSGIPLPRAQAPQPWQPPPSRGRPRAGTSLCPWNSGHPRCT